MSRYRIKSTGNEPCMTPDTSSGTFLVRFVRIDDVTKAPYPDLTVAASGNDPPTIQVKRPDLALVTGQDPNAIPSNQLILESVQLLLSHFL